MAFARYLVAPTLALSSISLSHTLLAPRTLHCDSAPAFGSRSGSSSSISSTLKAKSGPIIDPHQFATGSVIGIAAGLIFRRLGKIFFVIIGGSYLLLRALSSSGESMLGFPSLPSIGGLGGTDGGAVSIPWDRIRKFILNRSGTDDAVDSVGSLNQSSLAQFLTKDLTFKLSFLATFMIGLVNT